jgi:hypothetical protein
VRWASPNCLRPKAIWCSYHRVLFTTPDHRRLAGGSSGPDRNEDPHREATCGVGPVTGTAGSESRSGRGGRHAASSSRGPLGAHTIERPSPLLPLPSRPCRPRSGDRGSSGLPRERRDPSSNEDPHHGATRGVGPVTGTARSEELIGEVDVTQPSRPKALWCSYHQATFKTPDHRRLAGRGSGPDRNEDPHREATCGVGPVTGTAGSETLDGEADVTQPPQTSDPPPACR